MIRSAFLLRSLLFGLGMLPVLLSRVAEAQDNKLFITGIGLPIPTLRAIPRSVVRQMPSKARDLFWGTFQATRSTPSIVGLHLYIQHNPHPGSFTNHLYVLDIYSRKPGPTGFQRRNRIVFHCPDVRSLPTTVAAKWTWLQPSAHRGVVLALHIDPNGIDGDDVFIGLPGKLSERTTPFAILCGSWMASDICGIHTDFLHGGNGQTEIRVTLSPSGDPGAAIFHRDYQFTMQWNSRRHRFWPNSKARRIVKDYKWLRPEVIP